jgi:hypothetical protein
MQLLQTHSQLHTNNKLEVQLDKNLEEAKELKSVCPVAFAWLQ